MSIESLRKYFFNFSFLYKGILAYIAYIAIFPLFAAPLLHKMRGVRIKNIWNTYIAANVLIDTSFPEIIFIGEKVYLTRGVKVLAHTAFTPEQQKYTNIEYIRANVVIEDGAYIGANSIILPGVTIGYCALIGASSVVTKDIPPFAIAVGAPAKVIGDIRNHVWKQSARVAG